MSITEILSEIRKLSPAEKQQVINALLQSEQGPPKTDDEKRRELHRRLLAEGVIKSIPPRAVVEPDFEPVPIKGKPLSQTIIEERR